MMGVLTLPTGEGLDMPDATFAHPDLTAFARLDELGLEVVGQRLGPDRAVLGCRVVKPDQWCRWPVGSASPVGDRAAGHADLRSDGVPSSSRRDPAC